MAKIILNRKSEWMNRARGYKVLIDGEEKGAIKHGSADEYIVPAGSHTLECKVNWMKSNTYAVSVNDSDIKYLKVRIGMKYYTPVYVLLLIFVFIPFIANKAAMPISPGFEAVRVGLMVLIILYFVYYLTLGRHKYLVIEDDKDSVFAK